MFDGGLTDSVEFSRAGSWLHLAGLERLKDGCQVDGKCRAASVTFDVELTMSRVFGSGVVRREVGRKDDGR